MPKSRPPYPPEFRQRIIELVRKGRTPESLAEQFERSPQTIRNWLAQADRDAGQRADGLTTDEREELRRLRRENKTLREEREILKNFRARRGAVPPAGPETRDAAMLTGPRELWPSASWCHREPVKKHGPGVAGALDIGDAARRSRLGK